MCTSKIHYSASRYPNDLSIINHYTRTSHLQQSKLISNPERRVPRWLCARAPKSVAPQHRAWRSRNKPRTLLLAKSRVVISEESSPFAAASNSSFEVSSGYAGVQAIFGRLDQSEMRRLKRGSAICANVHEVWLCTCSMRDLRSRHTWSAPRLLSSLAPEARLTTS